MIPMTEAQLLHDIRLALGRQPDLVLWRNSTGSAEYGAGSLVGLHGRRLRHPRRVRYGLAPGSADLIGILAPSGRFVALEVKTPRGRATHAQEMFLALVRSRGGFACVVRSVDEARAALARAGLGGGGA